MYSARRLMSTTGSLALYGGGSSMVRGPQARIDMISDAARQDDKQQLTQQTADFPSLKIFTLSIKVTVTTAQTNATITWSVLIPQG
jgi:hypothetical protein